MISRQTWPTYLVIVHMPLTRPPIVHQVTAPDALTVIRKVTARIRRLQHLANVEGPDFVIQASEQWRAR